MQDDISDGVRDAVAQQLADPHRICIVGDTPYGGYAALAGAVFTPDLYECAVSINGVSDLPAYVTALLPNAGGSLAHTVSSSAAARVQKRIGRPGDPTLKARSPINAVDSVRARGTRAQGGGEGRIAAESAR
jgi:dipeptidyl aminopeptidase/acylaminoacyl peptidase